MGFFNRKKSKKLSQKIYSFEDTLKFAKDPMYEHYAFEPVNSNDLKMGFRVIPYKQQKDSIEKIKKRRASIELVSSPQQTDSINKIKTKRVATGFAYSVIAGGKNSEIDKDMNAKVINYNEYVAAKHKDDGHEIR